MTIETDLIMRESQNYFNDYMNSKIENRKYFYWDLDYFNRIDGIYFHQYELTPLQKDTINSEGKALFSDEEIVFSIKINTHRNELEVKNLSGKLPQYYYHSSYLKEYILLQIMKGNDAFSENIQSQQEINFIHAYLRYAIDHKISFSFTNFTMFDNTKQYAKLMKSLESDSTNDEIIKDIAQLKNRIKTLRILKTIESKITFLFKLPDLEDKEELRAALSVLSKNKKELLFRGQADSNWMLDSSVTRDESLLNNEHNLFQTILALKPNEFTNDDTDYEKLITMQHYGLPTRLLDVTRNPLISIFFASNNLDRRYQDGMIYVFENKEFLNPDDEKVKDLTKITKLDYAQIQSITSGSDMELLKKNHFIRGVAKNQRINNQSGDFIFVGLGESSKKNNDIESLVDGYLIIDYQVKKILLENLEVMNIHGGSVYPELGNMSSYLVEKYRK